MDNEKRYKGHMKGFSIVLIGFLLVGFLMPGVSAAPTASRDLPVSADAGDSITVSLDITVVADEITGLIVSDIIPSGWTVTDSSPTYNSFDSTTGEVKWVLYGGTLKTQTITYTVSIPASETSGDKIFSGTLSYTLDGDQVDNISGDTLISVTGVEPGAPIAVSRNLDSSATAGDSTSVSLAVTVASEPGINGAVIKDFVPSGWTVTDSSPTYNSFDSTTGEVKWVLYGETLKTQTITYTVSIPASETAGIKTFSGNVLYTLNDVETTDDTSGDTTIDVAGAPAPITVSRDISTMAAGECGNVKLKITLGDITGINGLILKEYMPSNDWNVTSANPAYNSYNASAGKVKWVLYGSSFVSQTITYTVCVPADATGNEEFSGEFLYNDAEGMPVTEVTGGDIEVPKVPEKSTRRRRRHMIVTITGGEKAGDVMTITVVDRNTEDPLKDVDIDVYLGEIKPLNKVISELTDNNGIVKFTPTESGTYLITADRTRYREEETEVVVAGEVVETTTTAPETTVETTVVETTVPETTVVETTVPETTVVETTVAPTTAPATTVAPTSVPTTLPAEKAPPVPMWLIVLIVLIVIIVIIYFVAKGGKGAEAPKSEEKPEAAGPKPEEEKKTNNKKKSEE